MIKDILELYVKDPENSQYNYDLGKHYENEKQYSAATGYFMRAADRAEDNQILYKSLISAAKCLIEHGDNFEIVKKILQNAIQVDSSKADSYSLLCLVYKYLGDNDSFADTYSMLSNAGKTEIYNMPNFAKIIKKDIPRVDTIRYSTDQSLKDFKQKIQTEYTRACVIPSDINEHLPVLLDLAKECNHITEMGVRSGVSTRSFLMSDAKIVSYDLDLDQDVFHLVNEARSVGKNVTYIKADVLEIDIEETDLLFIDTWHTYEQLKEELAMHADKAKKYIVFHDTNTYGLTNEGGEAHGTSQGLLPAIIEFLIDNQHWRFKKFLTNNNGLTVLERIIL